MNMRRSRVSHYTVYRSPSRNVNRSKHDNGVIFRHYISNPRRRIHAQGPGPSRSAEKANCRTSVNGDVAKMRSLFDEYYSPDFIYHDVSPGDTNREETMEEMAKYLSASSDVRYSIDDILAEGHKTAIRCTLRATHKATFMGMPATGREILVKQVEIHKIVGGKIAEAWGFSDSQGMTAQLAVIPGAPPSKSRPQ